jgi:nucleoside-diphosphate-sugar epimerase
MVKKEKLLVVGGTGFLGRHILLRAVKLGFKCSSISLNKINPKKKIKKVDYYNINILKKNEFAKLKVNFDYVINSGGYGGFKKVNNIYKDINAQYTGLKNLAGFFKKKKIKKFIQLGTSLEYGSNASPNDERMAAKNPLSDYGKSKLYATNYLLFLFKFFKFPVVILRLYQVYGSEQKGNRLIGYLIKSILKKKKIHVSHGEQIRDFLHISDFLDAIFLLIKNKKLSGQIINIGYGKGIKVKKVIKKITNLFPDKKIKILLKKNNNKETKILVPNINKVKKLIKWKPKISLSTGLNQIINSI